MSRRVVKGVAVLLCGTLLLQGCASGEQRVERVKELVKPGMTKDEVKAAIGEPISMTATQASGPPAGEYWLYRFDTDSTTVFDVMLGVLVVVVVVAVVVAAAAGGGGGSFGGLGGGGGGGGNLYEFDIHFSPAGRVDGISPVRATHPQ